MQKTTFYDRLLLVCLSLLIGLGGLSLLLCPADIYAREENRYLAALPFVSAQGLADGSVAKGLDTFAVERFPARGVLRCLHGITQLALGARESHGVILCRDKSLSRRIPIDEAAFTQNITDIGRLRERVGELPLTVAVVPCRLAARAAVLPRAYHTDRERALYCRLPADALTFSGCTDDAQWFRTDHHWTAKGAFFAYRELGGALGFTPLEESSLTPRTMSHSFLGTSYAAAGLPGIAPDTITLLCGEDDVAFHVTRDGAAAEFSGFYDNAKLAGRDQYAVFLGGNCGMLQIERQGEDTRPLLLVIRDSFAAPVLPFLARHYRILAIDPRYCAMPLGPFVEKADRVLLLCGIQTLTESAFLRTLLKRA